MVCVARILMEPCCMKPTVTSLPLTWPSQAKAVAQLLRLQLLQVLLSSYLDHLHGLSYVRQTLVRVYHANQIIRICFPTLQQNTSPLTLLPSYISVLGKKIDMAETAKDYPNQRACASKIEYILIYNSLRRSWTMPQASTRLGQIRVSSGI